ncbi:MAG TPA: hypothetical protein IGS53_04030 [Leptolyngbyaceae cyanobacterium M33_DOE_097]|uniref:Opioid growth factor receptor (OGFr) conserved domain-containing protein n=1 Tax=Oscillatoriales cyanobacterium SpSt-418 TaxID=2282169 RepID=A0A7C3KF58_9CYAN|nr:hypothetical protein [Leptolyngbyaceae cyanobacterium M33_DOE_097]
MQSPLVSFYSGEGRDRAGRMIQEIWAWDFEQLESVHDFIQWLFPLPEKSAFNPNAPTVDADVIAAFQTNPHLRQNLLHSFTVMLLFYGLQREQQNGAIAIHRAANYPQRKSEWVQPFNHNFLRITRILKCLRLFGLRTEAEAFYACLHSIYQENSQQIGHETFQYWMKAVQVKA